MDNQLDYLPQVKQRFIRSLNLGKEKNYQEIVKQIKDEIRPDYLKNIIAKARAVEQGDESLILAEELM